MKQWLKFELVRLQTFGDSRRLLWPLLLGVSVACSPAVNADQITLQEKQKMTAVDWEQQGKSLRAELDKHYQKLINTKTLQAQGQGVNIITDIVLKYISVDSTTNDAQKILIGAGFSVAQLSRNPLFFEEGDPFFIAASIDAYRSELFYSKTSIDVYLYPHPSDSFKKIKRIKALITKHSL